MCFWSVAYLNSTTVSRGNINFYEPIPVQRIICKSCRIVAFNDSKAAGAIDIDETDAIVLTDVDTSDAGASDEATRAIARWATASDVVTGERNPQCD
jgi:hypothetical protein